MGVHAPYKPMTHIACQIYAIRIIVYFSEISDHDALITYWTPLLTCT